MDKLTGMAVFARVVEAASFTAAGRQLGMSKSAVSKAVAALEDRLGARLLNRTTRRLAMTEVGQAFYERCARVVAEAEEAELAVTRLQVAPRGTLRINAPVSFGVRHLGPVLGEFVVRHPELEVDIDLSDRFVDLIEEGYDVAVRITRLANSSLIARRIADNRMIVCAAPAYWARHRRPSRPADLAAHDCLIYSYGATRGDWVFQVDGRSVRVRVSGRLQANNGDLHLAAALSGCGVASLPEFICGPALADGRLEAVLGEFMPEPAGIHAIYPHSRHLSAKVRAFVDFLVERFRDPDWSGRATAPAENWSAGAKGDAR